VEEMLSIGHSEYKQLLSQNEALQKLVCQLRKEIDLLKNGRNSKTSSTAPSHDTGRSNQVSLRGKSEKKSGGQPGHKGHSMQMSEHPDEVIEHGVYYCRHCGTSLHEAPVVGITCRQEVEIPVIRPCYMEHQILAKECPCCGLKNTGDFPAGVSAPIQYGASVKALPSYLSVYQYLPCRRMKNLLFDLFHLPVPERSIDNLLESMSRKAEVACNEIGERIVKEDVAGSHETGCRVNGRKHWIHVWQNKLHTFIVAHASRGHTVIEEYFPEGFPRSIYVSDCWASQSKTKSPGHQLCIAHLLRELLNFEKAPGSRWSVQMKELFSRALEVKRTLRAEDYLIPTVEVTALHTQLDALLAVDSSRFHAKEQAFIKRLIKNKNSIHAFLSHPEVPTDNNGSERAIRNVKVKTKVSGQFRNKEGKGADRFARIRSVIDTTIKNGRDVYSALDSLANC
jgi:transposase